jgi:hypothetical protein
MFQESTLLSASNSNAFFITYCVILLKITKISQSKFIDKKHPLKKGTPVFTLSTVKTSTKNLSFFMSRIMFPETQLKRKPWNWPTHVYIDKSFDRSVLELFKDLFCYIRNVTLTERTVTWMVNLEECKRKKNWSTLCFYSNISVVGLKEAIKLLTNKFEHENIPTQTRRNRNHTIETSRGNVQSILRIIKYTSSTWTAFGNISYHI